MVVNLPLVAGGDDSPSAPTGDSDWVHRSVDVAQRLLRARAGDVSLGDEVEILATHGQPTVFRARADGPVPYRSVIVKTHRHWAPYNPSNLAGPASGLFAEWAGLRFADEIWPANGVIPKLLAADRRHGVLVIEDLGRGPDLDDVLQGTDRDTATAALGQLAVALARLHGRSHPEHARYREISESLTSAPSNHQSWIDHHWAEAFAVLAELRVTPKGEVAAQLEQVRTAVAHPGLAGALCQAEPGDGNVLYIDRRVRLIDFEGSYWGHPATDAAFPRTAFGHLPGRCRLPEEQVDTFERAYRAELAAARPEFAEQLDQSLVQGSVGIAMSVLATRGTSLDRAQATPDPSRPHLEQLRTLTQTARERLSWQWRQIATQPVSGPLARFGSEVSARLAELWDLSDLPEPPIYPAFCAEPPPDAATP